MTDPRQPESAPAQILLWQNVDGFSKRLRERHSQHMRCGPGCSACCFTDITVFASEAVEILRWLGALDPGRKDELRRCREAPPESGLDPAGVSRPSCAFLVQGRCTIYPVRPLICRTQGLPLLLESSIDGEKLSMDVCPLNFTQPDSLPPAPQWLHLGRLNALQRIASQNPRPGPDLDAVKECCDDQGRISLTRLRRLL